MSTKYTPGPWRYWETVCGFRVAGHPKSIKAASCWVADVVYPENLVNAEDNARLIAAAPDLLEALTLAEDVLSRFPFSAEMWPNDIHPQTGLGKIRAAIAKATGESQ